MPITLYELAGANPDMRYSPFCWRTRLALAHKGLAFDSIPWRLTDKDMIAFSGSTRVPVLVDGARTITDSFRIAEYLDDTYPDRPSLFGGPKGRAHVRFINTWSDTLGPSMLGCLLLDITNVLAPQDQAYFRQSREARFGMTLEAVVANRETTSRPAFRALLAPVRALLAQQPWLGGDTPDYADYILLGNLQWARCVSRFPLIANDDAVAEWHTRGLALFDGLLANAPIG